MSLGIPTPRLFDIGLPPFDLECGSALPRLHLRGWWWGPESDVPSLRALTRQAPSSDVQRPIAPTSPVVSSEPGLPPYPTVLLVHALTGDAQAGGPGGWWAPVIGPGRALDPQHTRLLCFNNLGSPYGSLGPTAADWPWVDAADPRSRAKSPLPTVPAPVTTWDQARALLRALDRLGIERVDAVLGGSLGAMIVLALGALAPERFGCLVPVAGSSAASPWIIGFNHVARQTILSDPEWPKAARGLSLARQLAQMTYRAEPGLSERQGRRVRSEDPEADDPFTARWQTSVPYAQETYLEHQGRKLVARYDAPSYLTQLAAMDHHDIERIPPVPSLEDRYDLGSPPWSGASRLCSRIEAVGIDTDVLYPAAHMRELAEADPIRRRYHELSSPHGHDGFLIEWSQIDDTLRRMGAPRDWLSHD